MNIPENTIISIDLHCILGKKSLVYHEEKNLGWPTQESMSGLNKSMMMRSISLEVGLKETATDDDMSHYLSHLYVE